MNKRTKNNFKKITKAMSMDMDIKVSVSNNFSSKDNHIIAYTLLFVGLGVLVVLGLVFRHDRSVLNFVFIASSVFYILWGIIHHALEDRLQKEILLEYLYIGIVALLLLMSALMES